MKTISEYKLGEAIRTKAYIKNATKGVASSGAPYLSLTFGDTGGTIEGKLWNVTPAQERILVTNTVVDVTGTISEYGGRPQISLQSVVQATGDVSDFVQSAPVDINKLRAHIEQTVYEMNHVTLQKIAQHFLTLFDKSLYEYPAAKKMHHAYRGGLAHHISGMLTLAKTAAAQYPGINIDLLNAGIIIHDLGKTVELTDPFSPEYSLEGNLLGHIPILFGELVKLESWFPGDESVLLLKHIVLSHHGKFEWGSPKQPGIIEAQLLHYIDHMDANMNALSTAMQSVEVGDMSPKIYAVNNQAFYQHTLTP